MTTIILDSNKDITCFKNFTTFTLTGILINNKQDLLILRITRWYKFCKRQGVLWRIADYYTVRKYAPENILKYIKLED